MTTPTWQQALDARLVRRLRRPLVRPGVVELRQARSILDRHLGMTSGLPLLDLVARGDGLADGPGAPVPIVYALARPFPTPGAPDAIAPAPETRGTPPFLAAATPIPATPGPGTEVIQRKVHPTAPRSPIPPVVPVPENRGRPRGSGAGTRTTAGAPPVVIGTPRTEMTRRPVEPAGPFPPAGPENVPVPSPEPRGGLRASGPGTRVVVAPRVREQVVREVAAAGLPAAPVSSPPSWSVPSGVPPTLAAAAGSVPTPLVADPAGIPTVGSAPSPALFLPAQLRPTTGPAHAAVGPLPALPLPLAAPLPLATPRPAGPVLSRTGPASVPGPSPTAGPGPRPLPPTVVAGREREAIEPGRRAKVSAVEVDRIVDTVHRRFLRQLAIERERRGVR